MQIGLSLGQRSLLMLRVLRTQPDDGFVFGAHGSNQKSLVRISKKSASWLVMGLAKGRRASSGVVELIRDLSQSAEALPPWHGVMVFSSENKPKYP